MLDDDRRPAADGPSIGELAQQAIEKLQSDQAEPSDSQPSYSAEEKVRRTLQVLRGSDRAQTQKAARFLRRFARHSRGVDSGIVRPLLCQALEDSHWSLRWAAAEALGLLHDREAIPALCERLNDSSWIVQVAAIRALVELQASEAASQLSPLLASQRAQVREAAAEALGAFQDPQAIAPLADARAHDSDDFVRLAAIKAICQIDADSRRWLELALSDSYVDVRLFAARQLTPMMDERDLPVLSAMLDDDRSPAYESQSLRDLAMETLRRIDSPACRELLAAHDSQREGARL